ncbi:PLP-dependent aminotransferase family protein [Smaragdicoccus niigatensis]|uniref:aminotransferase-like domain-containing protein n=1 Tax=Smaragdicoccus niigatensis TaxID=359359 RepID=UPI0006869107|nr:PLP-dependent aminotransferase family protein [Smaragdicoccus niigatensis]
MADRFRLARRSQGMTSSPVRDILKILSRNDVISFAGGIPDAELIDRDAFHAAFDHVLTNNGRRALQYSATKGEPELLDQIAARLSRDLPTTPDHVQVLSGSQEGIYLVGQVLIEPGDVVLVEQPTYLAAIQAFALAGAQLIPVKTDDHGVLPAALEEAIEQHQPKFVYLIPTFQNPTGRTMDAARRQAVADVLVRTGTPLVEDDPYGELRYSGERVAPIAALPGLGPQTILLNSASKVMAPGVRIGWLRAEGPILRTIEIAKQAVGLQTAVTDQLAVARYLDTNDLDDHIRRIAAVYRERRDAMYTGLRSVLPDTASTTNPEGGMFLWVDLRGSVDTAANLNRAVEQGVAYVPGPAFYASDPNPATMRLSFVTNTPETIAEGVRRLGATFGWPKAAPSR